MRQQLGGPPAPALPWRWLNLRTLAASNLQALSSAAAADLDVPDAAWHATPKALLAVGLMAEEAAKVELAARFPAGPAAAVAGQAGQAAAERHA